MGPAARQPHRRHQPVAGEPVRPALGAVQRALPAGHDLGLRHQSGAADLPVAAASLLRDGPEPGGGSGPVGQVDVASYPDDHVAHAEAGAARCVRDQPRALPGRHHGADPYRAAGKCERLFRRDLHASYAGPERRHKRQRVLARPDGDHFRARGDVPAADVARGALLPSARARLPPLGDQARAVALADHLGDVPGIVRDRRIAATRHALDVVYPVCRGAVAVRVPPPGRGVVPTAPHRPDGRGRPSSTARPSAS